MTPMPDERSVIVNADDFGLSHGINRGIIEAHERGILTSASLMVRYDAAVEAAEYARANTAFGVGLHVDLGEWACVGGHWGPRYEVVPIDAGFPEFVDEIRRQLDRFRELVGRNPSHIDTHQHFHRHEPVRSAAGSVAMELDAPLREFTPAVWHCGHFYGQSGGGDLYPELLSPASLVQLLKDMPAGISELACHPAALLDFDSSYGRERLLEHAALCDASVKQAVVDEHIRMVAFADLSPEQRRVVIPPKT